MNSKDLKQQAASRLTGNAYRLTLQHSAIAFGASFLVTLIGFFLTRQADGTAGLSGIGMRSLLLTVQSVVSYGVVLLMPFWDLGYSYTALGIARREHRDFSSLAEGFRRFFPAMRMFLLQTVLVLGIAYLCLQAATIVFMLSPWSDGLFAMAEQLMADPNATVDMATVEALLPMLIPVYVLFAALLAGFLLPILYRLRLATFAIVDKATGAREAFRQSAAAMRGKRFAFFKLDLSFWWYYGLLLLAGVLTSGDVLLASIGIPTGDVGYLLFTALGGVAQLLVMWRFAPYVSTTYATAYNQLIMDNGQLRIEN